MALLWHVRQNVYSCSVHFLFLVYLVVFRVNHAHTIGHDRVATFSTAARSSKHIVQEARNTSLMEPTSRRFLLLHLALALSNAGPASVSRSFVRAAMDLSSDFSSSAKRSCSSPSFATRSDRSFTSSSSFARTPSTCRVGFVNVGGRGERDREREMQKEILGWKERGVNSFAARLGHVDTHTQTYI